MTRIDDSGASALGAAAAPRDVSTASADDADAVADVVATSRGVLSRRSRSVWIGPALLVLLSLVPASAGVWRLFNLASGAPVTDANARFFAAPVPVVLHVLSVIPYSLLGALQFSEPVRRRWGAWHRRAGRLLAAFGLVCAVTGVWMSVSYPVPVALQGPLLLGARVLVGVAMVVALVLGWRRILQRDVAAHEAWMMRAYALGLGAGTQVILMLPWTLAVGDVVGPVRDGLMTLAWLLNLTVAEWIIARRFRARAA